MVQNLTYTQYGDYYIPDIRLAHMGIHTLGKYGRMRRAFLEQNKPMLFNDMVLTETLFLHLWEVQQTCELLGYNFIPSWVKTSCQLGTKLKM